MQERNVDFEIPLTEDQWEQIGRRAAALGPEEGGFAWTEQEPDRIHVYLRNEEARGLWRTVVSDPESYGSSEREVAQFVFNGGRPFAHLEALPSIDEPAVLPQEETAVEVGQERFVRERWQQLLRESGVHYQRDHVSPEAER